MSKSVHYRERDSDYDDETLHHSIDTYTPSIRYYNSRSRRTDYNRRPTCTAREWFCHGAGCRRRRCVFEGYWTRTSMNLHVGNQYEDGSPAWATDRTKSRWFPERLMVWAFGQGQATYPRGGEKLWRKQKANLRTLKTIRARWFFSNYVLGLKFDIFLDSIWKNWCLW